MDKKITLQSGTLTYIPFIQRISFKIIIFIIIYSIYFHFDFRKVINIKIDGKKFKKTKINEIQTKSSGTNQIKIGVLYVWGIDEGGVSTFIHNFLREFQFESKYKLYFFSHYDYKAFNFTYKNIEYYDVFQFTNMSYVKAMENIIKKNSIAILIYNNYSPEVFRLEKKHVIKIITIFHGSYLGNLITGGCFLIFYLIFT